MASLFYMNSLPIDPHLRTDWLAVVCSCLLASHSRSSEIFLPINQECPEHAVIVYADRWLVSLQFYIALFLIMFVKYRERALYTPIKVYPVRSRGPHILAAVRENACSQEVCVFSIVSYSPAVLVCSWHSRYFCIQPFQSTPESIHGNTFHFQFSLTLPYHW